MQTKSNKAIVLEVYKYIIGKLDLSLVDTYIDDRYKQHSPTIKDGKAGLVEMLELMKKMPRPAEIKSPVVRIIQDGDFVVSHMDLVFMGKRLAVIDMFRLENGKLIEHWDAVQTQPDRYETAITMTNGRKAIGDLDHTADNKALGLKFFEEVFVNKNTSALATWLSASYTEHDAGITDGIHNYLLMADARTVIKVHRVLGEGNFVVVQSEGEVKGQGHVFYDILSLEDNRVAEHWHIEQHIPLVMAAHANGMI